MENFTLVASVHDLEDGEMKNYYVNDHNVLLVRIGDNFHAVGAICSHAYAELWEGELDECYVTCPLHFASFDVRDGSVVDPPATEPIPVFDVRIEEEKIWISNQPQGIPS